MLRILKGLAARLPGVFRLWRIWAGVLLILFAVTAPPGLNAARDHNDRVMQSAVVAYAALRAINASLSTAKETTIGVEMFGSVEGKPAMVLDPVDETVARVSGAIFALAGLSAILAVTLGPAAQTGAAVAGVGLVAIGIAARLGATFSGTLWGGVRRCVALGLFLALVLPLGYAGGGWIGERATEGRLTAALEQLQGQEREITESVEAVSGEVGRPAPEAIPSDRGSSTRPEEGSVMDRVFGNVGTAAGSVASAGREAVEGLRRQADAARSAVPDMAQVQARGAAIVESGVSLLAVYTVRLVVFPALTLLFLWAFLRRTLS